jgi:hypothetical protein
MRMNLGWHCLGALRRGAWPGLHGLGCTGPCGARVRDMTGFCAVRGLVGGPVPVARV